MKIPHLPLILVGPLFLASCSTQPDIGDVPTMARAEMKIYPFKSDILHAPKLTGWKQIPANETSFRGRCIQHPTGLWTVSLDQKPPLPPILITTASGKTKRLTEEWAPEEGGADSAHIFAFIRGDKTLIIIQGTSDLTYEETRLIYRVDEVIDLHRYAEAGGSIDPITPAKKPRYKVYPPN